LDNPSSYGESTDFATKERKSIQQKLALSCPKWSPVIQRVVQQVARRQSQILRSQPLPKLAQLALFAQSNNPDITAELTFFKILPLVYELGLR